MSACFDYASKSCSLHASPLSSKQHMMKAKPGAPLAHLKPPAQMHNDAPLFREIKVLVIGNGGVGKTSMIKRFCTGIFTEAYKKTIGVDFLEKSQYVDSLGEEVRFMLWDTGE